jgi:hypothetical protein
MEAVFKELGRFYLKLSLLTLFVVLFYYSKKGFAEYKTLAVGIFIVFLQTALGFALIYLGGLLKERRG